MLVTSSIDGGKETRKDILSQGLCPKGGFRQLLVGAGARAETGIFILFPDDVNYEQHTSASSKKTYVGRDLDTVLSARRCGSPDSDDQRLTTSPLSHRCRQRLDHLKDEEERATLAVWGFGSRNHTFMARGRDGQLFEDADQSGARRELTTPNTTATWVKQGIPRG